MFSPEYFLYLMKSKKGLLILESLVILLILIGSSSASPYLLLACSLGMSYFLSCNVFSFVHSKKAIDTYFSLPVSRKAILSTGIVFITLFSSVPQMLALLVYSLFNNCFDIHVLIYVVTGIIITLALVSFNVALYLIANNNVDGVVMLSSYTLLPAFILLAMYTFLESFVAGYDGEYLKFVQYLSPGYMYILLFVNLIVSPSYHLFDISETFSVLISMVIALGFIALSIFILKKEFIERKVERAESISKGLFAYPMVIALYVSLIMFGISSNFEWSMEFVRDYFTLYLILFVFFVASFFLYKRKLEFSTKLPLIYIGMMIVTLVIAALGYSTKGFGIAYSYLNEKENTRYSIDYYNVEDPEINEWVKKEYNDESGVVYIEIKAENISSIGKTLDDDTMEVLTEIQKAATDKYYESDDYKYSGSMQVYNGCYYNKSEFKYMSRHSYYRLELLTLEQLKVLVKDKNVEVTIQTVDDTYAEKYAQDVTY